MSAPRLTPHQKRLKKEFERVLRDLDDVALRLKFVESLMTYKSPVTTEVRKKQTKFLKLLVRLAASTAGAVAIGLVLQRYPETRRHLASLFRRTKEAIPRDLAHEALDAAEHVPGGTSFFSFLKRLYTWQNVSVLGRLMSSS